MTQARPSSAGGLAPTRRPSSAATADGGGSAGGAGGKAPRGIDSVVCFAIAGQAYALDVAVVREVVAVSRWIPVPRAGTAILGVFALRGASLALVDTRALFGLPGAGEPTTALVVASGHRTLCALTIDRVTSVERFADAQLTPAVPGREPPQVAGFLAVDHSLVTVLDAATLVESLEQLRHAPTS